MQDNEPNLDQIDDYQKPMPKKKFSYMIKVLIVAAVAAVIISAAQTLLIN